MLTDLNRQDVDTDGFINGLRTRDGRKFRMVKWSGYEWVIELEGSKIRYSYKNNGGWSRLVEKNGRPCSVGELTLDEIKGLTDFYSGYDIIIDEDFY